MESVSSGEVNTGILETKDNEGVPNREILGLVSSMRAISRAVVKDHLLKENAVVISIRLRKERDWRERGVFQKFIFVARGNWVYVLGCLSQNSMPEREDDFRYCASHDSGWFDDGIYSFTKILREGPYKVLDGIEEIRILKISENNFHFAGDPTVRHLVDINGKEKIVRPKKENEK